MSSPTSSSRDDPPPFQGAVGNPSGAKEKYDSEKTADTVEIQEGVVVDDGLRRALLGRHVSLISLASVIGASCFYGFGAALNDSGPLGALIGFSIVGAF